ncbi:hypothetical protein LSHI6S_00345 [Leifsonia shinshuensis]
MQSDTPRIFVVHGHDGEAKHHVARVVLQLTGTEPIVLDEQASGGKTVIEKFEAYANTASAAIVLLTADDVGRSKRNTELQDRARQNVVFEFGYFAGRLGRERVIALTRGPLELPTDVAGVVYVDMERDDWKNKLALELKSMQIPVDLNNLTA